MKFYLKIKQVFISLYYAIGYEIATFQNSYI